MLSDNNRESGAPLRIPLALGMRVVESEDNRDQEGEDAEDTRGCGLETLSGFGGREGVTGRASMVIRTGNFKKFAAAPV
jgi:hypothetical protein